MKTYLMTNKQGQCGTLQTNKDIEEIKTYYEFDRIHELDNIVE